MSATSACFEDDTLTTLKEMRGFEGDKTLNIVFRSVYCTGDVALTV